VGINIFVENILILIFVCTNIKNIKINKYLYIYKRERERERETITMNFNIRSITKQQENIVKKEEVILDRNQFQHFLTENANRGQHTLIFKFSATWCGPCNNMLPQCNHWVNQLPADRFRFIAIDVDKSGDLFAFLKSKKISSSIPTMLCYRPTNEGFYPDQMVIGNDVEKVNQFFQFCVSEDA